jgi:hypothetical protein
MGSQTPKKLTIAINPKYLLFVILSFAGSFAGSTLLVYLLEASITVNCAPDLPRNNYSFPGMIQEFNGNTTPGHVINPVTTYFGNTINVDHESGMTFSKCQSQSFKSDLEPKALLADFGYVLLISIGITFFFWGIIILSKYIRITFKS